MARDSSSEPVAQHVLLEELERDLLGLDRRDRSPGQRVCEHEGDRADARAEVRDARGVWSRPRRLPGHGHVVDRVPVPARALENAEVLGERVVGQRVIEHSVHRGSRG